MVSCSHSFRRRAYFSLSHPRFLPTPSSADAIYDEAQATRDAYCTSLLSAATALQMTGGVAVSQPAHLQEAPPPLMHNSHMPAPGPGAVPALKKSVTADACVGTEPMGPPPATLQNGAGNVPERSVPDKTPKSEPKPEQPADFDDGLGSTDALSMMLGWIFSSVFNVIFFFLIGLPVRVIKYSIIFLSMYVLLATLWIYFADDNGAMTLGAGIDYGFNHPSIWQTGLGW